MICCETAWAVAVADRYVCRFATHKPPRFTDRLTQAKLYTLREAALEDVRALEAVGLAAYLVVLLAEGVPHVR